MSGPLVDEEALTDERNEAQLKAQAVDDDLRHVMSSPQGRRVIFRLIQGLANVMGGSYAGEATATAFNEGRRAVGIGLMLEVQRVSPELWNRLVAEHFLVQVKPAPVPKETP